MKQGVKRIVHPIMRKIGIEPYHLEHRREALQALRKIELHKGSLNKQNRSLCNEYAQDIFKSRYYAPWLYVYTAMSEKFKEGWIPDNFYGKVVVPKVKGKYGEISSLKSLNFSIFGSNSFPDLASYANGVFFRPDGQLVRPEEISERLFRDGSKVVFKLDSSQRGRGIHFFEKSNFSIERVKRLGSGLFQSYIEQDKELADFSLSSVSTLRVTTVINSALQPEVRASYLRLGGVGDTHIMPKSQFSVAVDMKNGKLHSSGYTSKWEEVSFHPDSDKRFQGVVYPKFAEACRTVMSLHAKIPYVSCIGWDICVDRSGRVNIIEWNGGHNGIKFTEATQGPCFEGMGWESLAG